MIDATFGVPQVDVGPATISPTAVGVKQYNLPVPGPTAGSSKGHPK